MAEVRGSSPLSSMTTWYFDQRQYPGKRSGELTLSWRLDGDGISDGYSVEEISAAELWSLWRSRYATEDQQAIRWMVHGSDGVAEPAPFVPRRRDSEDFLTFYTWPVDEEGVRLRWFDLPIEEKGWSREAVDGGADWNGGFIQEYTGWKPSALQPVVDLALIERVLGNGA